jgi:hypothetical protein
VKGTWREGSSTEDSERNVRGSAGNGTFFVGLNKGNLRHSARGIGQ